MPHRTARDLIECAQALRPGLGILCMSAHPLERLVAMGFVPGRYCLLQKPFSAAALRERYARCSIQARPADTVIVDDLRIAFKPVVLHTSNCSAGGRPQVIREVDPARPGALKAQATAN